MHHIDNLLTLYYFQIRLIILFNYIPSRILTQIYNKQLDNKMITPFVWKQSLENLVLQESSNFSHGPLFPAINNTFIYIHLHRQKDYNNFNCTLVHCDCFGTNIFQYYLEEEKSCNVDNKLYMLSESEVMVVEKQKQQLTNIDLITHQKNHFYYKFFGHRTDINLFIFSETNIICIKQRNLAKKYSFKLTYYDLPFVLVAKPIACNVYDYQTQMTVRKANNHSMIIWFNPLVKEKFILNVFDLLKGYYIIEAQYRPQFTISNVWQNKKGEFLLAAYFRHPLNTGRYYTNKILKLKTQNHYLSETNINVNVQYEAYGQRFGQCFNLGQFCFIQMEIYQQNFQEKDKIILRSLCLHNQSEQIIEIQRKKHRHDARIQYFLPSYNPRILYSLTWKSHQQLLEPQPSRKLKSMTLTCLFNCAQVSLHFLLCLNEDFDDDLLKDAVELIDFKSVSEESGQSLLEGREGDSDS